ncbi:MAG TPA: right-handed parallel beta-helix repeat-containing protein [Solirubrobacterales bacterium]|nr:right-handed parallel beta-helix repeat-containing protein [Solirubrobacterales bacterium]
MIVHRLARSSLAGPSVLALPLALVALLALAPGADGAARASHVHGSRTARAAAAHRAWARSDPDHDGLTNAAEVDRYHTNPHKFDTDGDGYGDGAEVRAGTNPRSAASRPSSPPSPSAPPSGPNPTETPAPGGPESSPESAEGPASSSPAEETTGSHHHPHPPNGSEHSSPGENSEEPEEEETTTAPEEGPGTPPTDTTPPQTTIATGPSLTTTSGAAGFSFTSSETGSSFECQLDGAEWVSCVSPDSYAVLGVGAHTFAVRAIDAAGNVDQSPATWRWTITAPEPEGGGAAEAPCTQTLAAGANLSTAISNAAAGAVICLPSGATSFNVTGVSKSKLTTVRGTGGTVGYSALHKSSNLRFEGIKFTNGLELLGATSNIQIVDNEFTGNFGIHAGGEAHTISGSKVSNVLIEGNYIHDTNYTGSQGTANGYGITASDGVSDFVIRGNTIKSPASDYIQSASPVDFDVDHNTFLGPSLLGSHEDHQDLWQIFGGGTNITFSDNVARNTETEESLLFQEGTFQNVVIENNLFDHDSRGYTCQIYQATGLVFRDNTIVGSHWGCLFRDLASAAAGSGYAVDHNLFVGTAEGADISTEGRAASWGVYDYNVSEDASASGTHSIRNWKPSWADATNYVPAGLPFEAGYRP